ncbi:MAG: hypothetical protein KAT56_01835, partial [Sedimentisphaerales bacterium]|nr:hypothetical protein [Sedimentisphaerales bacterium]
MLPGFRNSSPDTREPIVEVPRIIYCHPPISAAVPGTIAGHSILYQLVSENYRRVPRIIAGFPQASAGCPRFSSRASADDLPPSTFHLLP